MKRSYLKRSSSHFRERAKEAKPWRDQRVIDYPACWLCNNRHKPVEVHEIARGSRNRQKAIDAPFATLVTCRWCHGEKLHGDTEWTEIRQLALLKVKAPDDYDLAEYNALVGFGPNRIEQWEVDEWVNGSVP